VYSALSFSDDVVIEECQCYFNFDSVSDITAKRAHKFLTSYDKSDSL